MASMAIRLVFIFDNMHPIRWIAFLSKSVRTIDATKPPTQPILQEDVNRYLYVNRKHGLQRPNKFGLANILPWGKAVRLLSACNR